MTLPTPRPVSIASTLAFFVIGACAVAHAAEPVRFTVTVKDTASQVAEVKALVPTQGRSTIQLMMPAWSPGFYRVEDYAAKVRDLKVRGEDGEPLEIFRTKPNEWTVEAGARPRFVLTYGLLCDRRSVTTNEIAPNYAVLNPAATFVIPRGVVQARTSPIEVSLDLPSDWTAMTALPRPDRADRRRFRAPSYETLVDSPILAGRLSIHEFGVSGSEHLLVDAGDLGTWDGERGAGDLAKIAAETRRFWGALPFKRYLFLNVFRQGGGGLEHKDSTLLTSSAARMATPQAYLGWLSFVAHEYFHAFNVKRLRPVELGPFDFDQAPVTKSLWISEGLTTYFADLMVHRSGLSTRAEYLDGLSSQIEALQKQPGRLLQSVEQSSVEVWNNSNSGVGNADSTVSYYVKGDVMGFVLDARIRKATGDRKSIDDLLRLAYRRYSGHRGFTPQQFQDAASKVAGQDLSEWFRHAAQSAEELDYREALDWFGLRFEGGSEASRRWKLIVRDDATADQQARLNRWLSGHPGV